MHEQIQALEMHQILEALLYDNKARYEFFLSFNTTVSLFLVVIICLIMGKYGTIITMKDIDYYIDKLLAWHQGPEVIEGYCDLEKGDTILTEV